MAQPIARRSFLRWTVPVSVGLHVLLILLAVVRFAPPRTPVPVGVELRYAELPKMVIAKSEAGVSKRSRVHALNERVAAEARPPVTMGAKDGAVVSALERYKFELRQYLDSRKVYPEAARRLSQTGTVTVQFTVNGDGEILEVNMEKPSSSEILNRSALDLVKRAARFKPLPQEAGAQQLKLSFPIEYIL